jgi:hypothetical protein
VLELGHRQRVGGKSIDVVPEEQCPGAGIVDVLVDATERIPGFDCRVQQRLVFREGPITPR